MPVFENEPVRKRGYLGVLVAALGAIASAELLPDQYQTLVTTLVILLGGGAGIESSRSGENGSVGPLTHKQALEDRELQVRRLIEDESIKSSQDWEAQLAEVQTWQP